MDLMFGEVRPFQSRACDDEDEEDDIEYEVEVVLGGSGEAVRGVSTVVIAHGHLATDFCSTLLWCDKSVEAGQVVVAGRGEAPGDDTGDFHPRRPQPSRLFLAHDALVCCVTRDVTAAVATQFVHKLLAAVGEDTKLLVLSSHHYGSLHGHYDPGEDNCVVYSLRSPAFSHTPVYPPLPQPATIDSVPAAAMTESVVRGRACVVYSVYTETYSTGDLDLVVDALGKVFKSQPFLGLKLQPNKLANHRHNTARSDTLDRYM